jgi:hypothetical protein
MGWTDSHLHTFTVGKQAYSVPDPDWDWVKDERRVRLSDVVAARHKKFLYTYDMGDNWDHTLLIEKVLPPEEGATYPRCLAGKRACPPEDCGGVWGYAEFLEAISDPEHPEHEDMLEWIGGEFDPEAFDLEEVNAALRGVR